MNFCESDYRIWYNTLMKKVDNMNKNCYLLYGNNHFLIKEMTDKIFLQNEVPKESVEVYDFEESGLHLALSNALTLPFLVDKKGVVVRNSSFVTKHKNATDEEIEDLIRFCQMNVRETILIIQAPYERLDGHKKIVKYLKKNIISEDLNQKKDMNLYDFVKKQLSIHDLTIEAFALTQFINRINHDMDSVNNEINKMITYSKGKKVIDDEIVSQITSKDIDENIYNLVNSLLDDNKQRLMEIYEDLKATNTSEMWILSTMTNKFLEMLHTKSLIHMGYNQSDIMKYFNVSNGRAYYMKKNADEISDSKLESYIKRLSELDYKIKSGQIDKTIGIELFLLKS